MSNPTVSIITATFNSQRFVKETIDSILAQTYTDWELIITDDESSDSTIDILESYSRMDKRIKIYRLKTNSGAGVARNNSIKHSQGRYIAFCDSDDQWMPNKLQKQIDFMTLYDCALTYSSYKLINEIGDKLGQVLAKKSLNYKEMLRNNYIGCLTAIYDTDKVGKVYMPIIRKRQDWGLWLKILKKDRIALGIIDTLAIYRVRSSSLSNKKKSLIKYNFNIYRKVEKFSIIKSSFLIIQFTYFYLRNKN